MKRALAILFLAALASGCALPEGKGGARICIQDSGFCHFPGE